jgi:hypothetical protein
VATDQNNRPEKDETDVFFPIRRALFIRTILGKTGSEELDMDDGLINALLRVDTYTHGARSLEKILTQLKTGSPNGINRSVLPGFNVLSMLVDYEEFINHLGEKKDSIYQAIRIAPEIHKNWMRLGDKENWKMEYHKPYNYLPSHLKNENIEAATRIPKILHILNLRMVKKTEAELYDCVDFREIIKNPDTLTRLAKAEHQGWIDYKKSQRWKQSSMRNDDKKHHNCMIPWEELPEKEKNKDKDAIKNYPAVLEKSGFVIVKVDD